AIAGTLWTDHGNADPRCSVGMLASAALHHHRNAAIWDRVPTVRSRVDGLVDGNDTNHDARAGQCSCGHALPRLCQCVRVHDVAARCTGFCAGTMDHSSGDCRLADAVLRLRGGPTSSAAGCPVARGDRDRCADLLYYGRNRGRLAETMMSKLTNFAAKLNPVSTNK